MNLRSSNKASLHTTYNTEQAGSSRPKDLKIDWVSNNVPVQVSQVSQVEPYSATMRQNEDSSSTGEESEEELAQIKASIKKATLTPELMATMLNEHIGIINHSLQGIKKNVKKIISYTVS